jgi:hypothetical protein
LELNRDIIEDFSKRVDPKVEVEDDNNKPENEIETIN